MNRWLGLGFVTAALVALVAVEAHAAPPRIRNPQRRRRRRRLDEVAACESSARREARPTTFRRKAEGVAALLDANPDLNELLESECGDDCWNFKRWQKGGRRGPKPAGRRDVRFDAFNERLDLKGKRRVGSWAEGVYKVVPASRRWEDFEKLVPVLEEATGMRVHVPEQTDRVHLAREMGKRCRELPEIVLEEAPF